MVFLNCSQPGRMTKRQEQRDREEVRGPKQAILALDHVQSLFLIFHENPSTRRTTGLHGKTASRAGNLFAAFYEGLVFTSQKMACLVRSYVNGYLSARPISTARMLC